MNPQQILKEAQKNKYAIGSFNFCNAEILGAIVAAAKKMESPVIVSTSEGEASFIGMNQAAALVRAWREETDWPIFLNLDHGKSLEKIKEAAAAGYDMVHFDGSALPYEENIRETKRAADFCCENNILIEGELGYLRGTSALHREVLEIDEKDLTSPTQAADFTEKTGVDSLAIAIGNAHGIFIQSAEKLYLDRLAAIKDILGERVFLVLHGGSGVSAEDIRRAIDGGIVKVNVNTEMRLAFHGALKKIIEEEPEQTTPYKFLAPAARAVQKVVEEKIQIFKS